MVCVPCIVIPVLLWVFHKFIQPYMLKFWNPWKKQALGNDFANDMTNGNDKDIPDSPEAEYIKKQIKNNPVMMFSKTTCSFCRMAKQLLEEVGVTYTVEEINHLDNCQQVQDVFEKMTSQRTVPRIFVGGKCIGGSSEAWTLHNQGKLISMMKDADAKFKDKAA